LLLYRKLDISWLTRDDAEDVEDFSTFFGAPNGSLCEQEQSFGCF
jgi:hypothetical protein